MIALWATDLELGPADIEKLADAYADHLVVKRQFEKGHAQITRTADGAVRIDIAPYPEAGARLQEMLASDFRAILDSDKADRVLEKIEGMAQIDFAGFGQNGQVIVISELPPIHPDAAPFYRMERAQKGPGLTTASSSSNLGRRSLESSDFGYVAPYLSPGRD